MQIQKNTSLKPYNTFGIDVKADSFVEVGTRDELISILSDNTEPLLVLGEGSNLLFTKNFNGLAVKMNVKGIELIKEDKDFVYLKVGAGEAWHQFVLYCVEHNYAGIENMSLIPGTVGASPIQNIGAYGVEVKDVIDEVEVIDRKEHLIKCFSNKECNFGYRSSVFKTTEKDNYIIISVTYRLSKNGNINTTYGAIESELKNMDVIQPTIKDISNAVINIRNSKLPDPKKIGNSGSFFKNPVISFLKKKELLSKFPSMPHYLQKNGDFKIAAGWLIEQAGWKGKRINDYGVHANQALVLVNYGGATGSEIYKLSEDIISSIKQQFDIELEREVNII